MGCWMGCGGLWRVGSYARCSCLSWICAADWWVDPLAQHRRTFLVQEERFAHARVQDGCTREAVAAASVCVFWWSPPNPSSVDVTLSWPPCVAVQEGQGTGHDEGIISLANWASEQASGLFSLPTWRSGRSWTRFILFSTRFSLYTLQSLLPFPGFSLVHFLGNTSPGIVLSALFGKGHNDSTICPLIALTRCVLCRVVRVCVSCCIAAWVVVVLFFWIVLGVYLFW